MRTQRPALTGPLQSVWHAIIVTGGWILFAAFWWVVLPQSMQGFTGIVWILAGAILLLPLATLFWVMHNREIHFRKGPRRQVRLVAASYSHDWAGRPVRADFDTLRHAREIIILSSAAEKYFVAAGAARP